MPCRYDDVPSTTLNDLQKQLDAQAQELCKARTVLSALIHALDLKSVPAQLKTDLQEQLTAFRAHREKDKQRAIGEIEMQLQKVAERIRKIRELGGLPQDKLMQEVDELETKVAMLKGSDPLQTDLY